MTNLLDRLATEALLDDDKETLARLPKILEIVVGKRCPMCDGSNVEMGRDDENYCEDCDDYFSPSEKATEEYQDVIGDRQLRQRSRRKARR